MKNKTKSKTVKINRCKMCSIKIKDVGNCQNCNKSLTVITDMLENTFKMTAKDHLLYSVYFGAVYTSLKEKRDTLKKLSGDSVSYFSLAILEGAEAKNGNRKPGNYLQYMSNGAIISCHFYDDNKRLPTPEEMKELMKFFDERMMEGAK